MSTREKPQEQEESQNTAFKEPEEVYEELQRRGQYIVNGNDAEPPGRGHYVADLDNKESSEGIESIDNESTTP